MFATLYPTLTYNFVVIVWRLRTIRLYEFSLTSVPIVSLLLCSRVFCEHYLHHMLSRLYMFSYAIEQNKPTHIILEIIHNHQIKNVSIVLLWMRSFVKYFFYKWRIFSKFHRLYSFNFFGKILISVLSSLLLECVILFTSVIDVDVAHRICSLFLPDLQADCNFHGFRFFPGARCPVTLRRRTRHVT